MATKAVPQANGVPRKPAARAPAARKPAAKAPPRAGANRAAPVTNKAASVAGGDAPGGGSAYSIMATRIANRVAEMAESITFVERPQSKVQQQQQEQMVQEDRKKPPRKLEMRLQNGSKDSVAFSAPFLDNTLQKMLQLQNRMLSTTAELSKTDGVEEKVIKEHAAQSAELSRIIALICAEKARQGRTLNFGVDHTPPPNNEKKQASPPKSPAPSLSGSGYQRKRRITTGEDAAGSPPKKRGATKETQLAVPRQGRQPFAELDPNTVPQNAVVNHGAVLHNGKHRVTYDIATEELLRVILRQPAIKRGYTAQAQWKFDVVEAAGGGVLNVVTKLKKPSATSKPLRIWKFFIKGTST